MNGFIVNQTKVNMSLSTEAGTITADIVIGAETRAENGTVVSSGGVHLASFGHQNPSGFMVFFHQNDLTPEARLAIHTAIENFMTGAYQALTTPQGNPQEPSGEAGEEGKNPGEEDAE